MSFSSLSPHPAAPPGPDRAGAHLRRAALMAALACAMLACAGTRPPTWPPRPGESAARITIYADHYHSIIALPTGGKTSEEWAYGERIWFYDEKNTKRREAYYFMLDALRAMFWPNAGVIEISRMDKPYDARNPENKVSVWQFPVSREGLRRMRDYLQKSIGSRKALLDDGGQVYYPAATRYHALHTCHHYVAGALREAGVPVRPAYCFLPSGLWFQLDRLARQSAAR